MKVYENISLKPYNTFGIDVKARRLVVIEPDDELSGKWKVESGKLLVLGSGSNMVFTKDYDGTVITLARNFQFSIFNFQFVSAWAGMVMDDLIQWTLDHGLYGLENLSAIPGTVGAAPVQNVGAYGIEAKDIIHSVLTIETATGNQRTFHRDECQFGYRDSIFKNQLKGQYIVWSVTFCLDKTFSPDLRYKAIADALARNGINNPTPRQLADTIADIRWAKLPRPEETGSAGSFFKNPVVETAQYLRLKAQYPDLVAYPAEGGYKLAAGWLIEHTGWKGRSLGRCGVYEKQALVLVNLGGCTGQEVLNLSDAVTADVYKQFGVTLEKEAIIL